MNNRVGRVMVDLRVATFVFVALTSSLGSAKGSPQTSGMCGAEHASDLDRAKQERIDEHFDKAMQDAQAVLNAEPQNLRARYTIGLVELDRSLSGTAAQRAKVRNQGMADLLKVADGVETALKDRNAPLITCLKDQRVFSIMNTIAFYYSGKNDLGKTETYLKRSLDFDKQGLLDEDTKRKTLGNLGSYYYTIGDYAQARDYLSRAIAEGNPNPNLKKRLDAIRIITGNKT